MIELNLDIDKLFSHSEELVLLVDNNKKIIYANKKAGLHLGNPLCTKEIEHLFSFDVCILEKENILDYSPISEALSSKIPFRAEILLQTGENDFRKFNLRSLKIEENTLVILSDLPIDGYAKRVAGLERENADFLLVKERAKNLAIRTGLINRISNSIRESINLEEIINIITNEVISTLGLAGGHFVYQEELLNKEDSGIIRALEQKKAVVSAVMTDHESGIIQTRLVSPVLYREEILGALVFYHINNKKSWHEEEINLIEGISSQLAAAITQSRAQMRLVQSEKMASLGQLVAGVAHEINTPLGAINSNNSIFLKCLSKISLPDNINEVFKETITTNSEAIRRITNLVKSLKNFARLDEAEFQEADLHEGIKNTLMLINHEIKGRVEIIEDFGGVPPVKCYPNQLNQVFMNILVNAYQSIGDKGTITIKTRASGQNVLIQISDTGCGIPKDHLNRIFDPGFTTKNVGVGTGLGLSICYRIIQKHNGSISVESEVGKGTTFSIELPV